MFYKKWLGNLEEKRLGLFISFSKVKMRQFNLKIQEIF